MAKTLLPNDLRDFLSIISFLGFVGIFMSFTLKNPALNELMTPLFLIIGGAGLMVVGKVFSIGRWLKDGIQRNETNQIFSILFGLSSMIIGFLLVFGTVISTEIEGIIGFLALAPAVFILFDYITKNKKGFC